MFDGRRAGVAKVAAAILWLSAPAVAEPAISAARPADNGFVVHAVASELQARETRIYVRVPDKAVAGERLRVLYLASGRSRR